MIADGKAFVRLAQLRGRIAALARGGRYDLTIDLLGELVRADLALGLPADGLLRARQAAALAEARGEPIAGPMVVLAATLLPAGALDEALDACTVAIERATSSERPRIEAMARLVGGSAQRRAGRLADARMLLDAARGAAARLGGSALAGIALAELGWIDLAEGQPAAAATCFEFGAEFLRRAHAEPRAPHDLGTAMHAEASVEADTLAIACWAAAGDLEITAERSSRVADAARAAKRLDLVATIDGVLADLVLRRAPEAAQQACALAAESAQLLGTGPVARELAAQARLRQVRTAVDATDRARHLEAGIELALALPAPRACARLGSFLVTLVEDAERGRRTPDRGELERLAGAITSLGDAELSEMARAVIAELG